jgi:ribosomal protein S18 acetylase RimI-like enzyme
MIRLAPLGEADYQIWLAQAIEGYAAEKVRAGNWPADEAIRRSREEFARLLPDGLATPANQLLAIEDAADGTHVGILWWAIPGAGRARAFIYDFVIHEPYRRRGYGLQALRALEELARGMGIREVALHVFGHNHAARALYEKAGYEITNINMTRTLDQGAR